MPWFLAKYKRVEVDRDYVILNQRDETLKLVFIALGCHGQISSLS